MFVFRLYDYKAVSELLCSFAAFFLFIFKENIMKIYIFKIADYKRKTNFLRNTRMVIING
jgi:hypothetical protein